MRIISCSGNLTTRIVWSLIIEIIIFLITVGLAMANSADWPGAFFWITMVTVVILNSKKKYFYLNFLF